MADRLTAPDLIDQLLDDGSWTSWDAAPDRGGLDPAYVAELERAEQKSGLDESILTGRGTLDGQPVAVIAGEFSFLAGSVGRAASDRLVAGIERATAEGLPLVGLTCSGGTRMQEGTPAFVQMVRIGAAIAAHRAAGLAYVAYLRNPTTGGVMATWGSLGQITYAEPGALAGFLGPRVYSALYGEEFPPGVQVAEHLAEVGVIDGVVAPHDLRDRLATVLRALTRDGEAAPSDAGTVPATLDTWDAVTRTRRAERPGVRDLLAAQATDVVELSGTQAGESASALLLAIARIGGQPCVVVGQDRAAEAEGHKLGPAALRVARRGFALAAELRIPVLTVIDTRGGELSAAAEEGAMAGEIARCLGDLVTCGAPTLGLMLGEGNGGAALAFLPADRIVAAQHAWLSPLPPEGASAIVHRDTDHAAEMAEAQQVLAVGLAGRGVVDRVVAEVPDAADESPAFLARLGGVLAEELSRLHAAGAGTASARSQRYAF
ncbi:carboxyl transferase domain-containing protein [Nocardioides jiangxiensis]|uniref:Carboxyl transferase domain-containing protein n=1 Tax=Nocardioides jiangxiensis TaxID=3064524 RepID=A0ABT9B0Q5_9ACTN|nr:carboxyl transferase domain-containing protein [Nocardioides sp. WY-20]MDO7868404.1 carboxyl transferase domain-containing protein [Nocardioides sp. WY-20]